MHSEALARFAENLGGALQELASDLRGEQLVRKSDMPPISTPAAQLSSQRLGVREQQVAVLFAGRAAGRVLTAREIANGIGGYDQANIYFPIRSLVKKGLLEEVPGGPPQRWRAAERGAHEIDEPARKAAEAHMESSPNSAIPPMREHFQQALDGLLATARQDGEPDCVVSARELHMLVGGYPGTNHRMPVCCQVMRATMRDDDEVIHEPPKGAGATLTIRYRLDH
jgi:hypothetical protein